MYLLYDRCYLSLIYSIIYVFFRNFSFLFMDSVIPSLLVDGKVRLHWTSHTSETIAATHDQYGRNDSLTAP